MYKHRKVLYFTDTGRVKMKKLTSTYSSEVSIQEEKYLESIIKKPKDTDVEIF